MKRFCLPILLLHFFCITMQAQETPISYGQSITAALDNAPEIDPFIFTATEGDRIIIRITSSNVFVSPCIELRDAMTGMVLQSDCDPSIARIDFTILSSGEYLILVSDSGGDDTGGYCLSLQEVSDPPIFANACSTTVQEMDCVTSMPALTFDANQGNIILFNLTSSNVFVSPCLQLYGPSDTLIISDCDPSLVSLEVNAPEDGCYTAVLYDSGGDDAGNLNFSISFVTGMCTDCSTGPVDEICDNGMDDDNDGLIDCEDPDCSFTINVSSNSPVDLGQTIDLMASGGDTYTWSGPDGFTSDDQNPSINNASILNAGEYSVTVTNATNCTAVGTTNVIVNSIPNQATVVLGEVEEAVGDTVLLPFFVQSCPLLASFQGTIQLIDPTVAQPIGILDGLLEMVSFNVANNTFSFFDMGGTGVAIEPTDVLFSLQLVLTGTPGASSVVDLTNDPLAIQLACIENGIPNLMEIVNVEEGLVSILNEVMISGDVTTCEEEAIAQATVSLMIANPSNTSSFVTTNDGTYFFDQVPAGSDATLSVSKDINPQNGITTFGLFVAQQFLLGMEPPLITEACQVIAMNANCDGSATSFDLFTIQRVLVGLDETFADCPSWVFYPEDHVFPNPFNATNIFPYPQTVDLVNLSTDQDIPFKGVKIGDVLLDSDPLNLNDTNGDTRTENKLNLKSQMTFDPNQQELVLQLRSDNFQDLVSTQFGMAYDQEHLEFLEFIPQHWHPLLAQKPDEQNLLSLSWFSRSGVGQSFAADENLFQLRFKVKKTMEDFSTAFQLSEHLPTEIADASWTAWDIKLPSALLTEKMEAQLYPLQPNPFRETTTIRFYLPEATKASLRIHNALGQLIYFKQAAYSSGAHEIPFNEPNLSTGIYYLSLEAGNFQASRKLILID